MKLARAGEHPPTFIPWCSLCNLPVSKYQYRVPKYDTDTINFDAQCCGKTMGAKVTLAQMARLRASGEKFYLVVQTKRTQEIKAQPRRAG